MTAIARPLSVSIATRNRPAAVLHRCIRSLGAIGGLIDRAIVVDDASDPVVAFDAVAAVAREIGVAIEPVRLETHTGLASARNIIARLARTPYLLNLDDDAFLIGDSSVRKALTVLDNDPSIAAVAFAQANADGVPYAGIQPAQNVAHPCYVPSFTGFGYVIRRDRLLEIGGYRDIFFINGEERELCLRCLDRGLRVVYLPDAVVGHIADAANRDDRTFARLITRNDCLNSLYNDPLPRVFYVILYKLWSFSRRRAHIAGGDPGGFMWVVRELLHHGRGVLAERRPVKWKTLREWKRLRMESPAYTPPVR